MGQLMIVSGPSAGRTMHLSKVTTLGRSSEAEVQFDDLTVSREHARILRDEQGRYILEDLHSGNGTFLNGIKIGSESVHEGDEIRIGESLMIFRTPDAPASVIAADRTLLEVSGTAAQSSVINAINVDSNIAARGVSDDSTMEELAGANRRLQIMCNMFRSIGTDLDEDTLLAKILDTLFRVFPDTLRGFIILRDPESGELQPRATKTVGQELDNRLAISDTILQYVMEKKQAVLSSDAMHDGRFKDSASVANLQVRSVMCAPLLHEGNVLGFISMDTQRISRSYDEVGLSLLAGISNQASLAIANARMHARLVQRRRIEQDLHNAARIQHNFLPQQLPSVEGYDFADWYRTAQEVGGDFYDFIPLADGRLGIAVGDVSGKGITAALMMAKMTGYVRFHAAEGAPPEVILQKINKAIAASDTEVFVTLMFAILDSNTHELVLSNAGHLPPMVRRADGTVHLAECPSGFPIGITTEADFSQASLQLGEQDRVCLFTDGIIEAMNENKEPYGYERLEQVLRDSPVEAKGIVEAIQQSVRQYMGPADQSDDLTLVCFGPC